MNILALNGSPHKSGSTSKLTAIFINEAESAGHTVTGLQVGT